MPTKRKDKRFEKKVYDKRQGKFIHVYGNSSAEANKKAAELRVELEKGIDVSAGKSTFSERAIIWLASKKAKGISDQWYATYKASVDHLNRYIGFMPIKEVNPENIEAVLNALAIENPNTKKPASKKTLMNIVSTANQIFKNANKNRKIVFNPADEIELPITNEGKIRRALTEIEQNWILETDHRAKTAAMLMMYAGLRRGELMALLWSDINLAEKTISVTKAFEMVKGVPILKHCAKTDAGNRVIDIPRRLTDYLTGIQRKSLYVCVNAKGKPHNDQSWRVMWDSYLKAINRLHGDFTPFQNKPRSKFDPKGTPFVIPRFTAHWLRHTFCTMMYHAGVDLLTAQKQMGHADIKTTLAIYTHLDAVYKRKSMTKLDDYIDDFLSSRSSKKSSNAL